MAYEGNQKGMQGKAGNFKNNGGNNRYIKTPITDFPMEKVAINSNITTTQLRKTLSSIILVSNKAKLENRNGDKGSAISEVIKKELNKLLVRTIYQAGRHKEVKALVNDRDLNFIKSIKDIKTYNDLEAFHCKFEEVVAFAKYHKE